MKNDSEMISVDFEHVKEFTALMYAVVEEVALKSHEYIGTHSKPYSFSNYPEREKYFFEDDSRYNIYCEQIPVARYGISKYELGKLAEEAYDYHEIFYSPYAELVNIRLGNKPRTDYVKIEEFDSFHETIRYLEEHDDLIEILKRSNKETKLEKRLARIICSAVVRYLFEVHATEKIPDNYKERLHFLLIEKIRFLFARELHVRMCVPVSLATFSQEKIDLSQSVKIIKISEDIQKSRQMECRYELQNESWVAAAATHMIIIDGYYCNNKKDLDILDILHDSECYPLELFEEVIGIIRIVTGSNIGYEQILALPQDWFDTFNADLPIVYGARIQCINPSEYKKHWTQLEITEITLEQISKIQELYISLEKLHQNAKAKKGKEAGEAKRLLFALKRFNRCKLRNEDDDMATDATIGLEALLLGGEKGEITYKLSSRIPVVFQFIKNENFTPANSRRLMGKIYNYRSNIVHGSELKESDQIEVINGKEFKVSQLAVEFLRYTLQFMLEHPEYLDAKKFDEYIDQAVNKMP